MWLNAFTSGPFFYVGTYTLKENTGGNAVEISNCILWLASNGLLNRLSCMLAGFSSCVCICSYIHMSYMQVIDWGVCKPDKGTFYLPAARQLKAKQSLGVPLM